MKLNRIDHAIQTCKEYLDATASMGTEIEAYLTRYLLILISAVFEEEIKNIVAKRAALVKDTAVTAFVNSASRNLLRSIKTSEISGFLKKFGPDYKSDFSNKITNTRAEECFNTIISNRHITAHTSGSNMTFNELVQFYEEGHKVLDELVEVLMGNSLGGEIKENSTNNMSTSIVDRSTIENQKANKITNTQEAQSI